MQRPGERCRLPVAIETYYSSNTIVKVRSGLDVRLNICFLSQCTPLHAQIAKVHAARVPLCLYLSHEVAVTP